jgi:hypothetical protein
LGERPLKGTNKVFVSSEFGGWGLLRVSVQALASIAGINATNALFREQKKNCSILRICKNHPQTMKNDR